MIEYKIEFKGRYNGINKNQLKGTPLYNLFRNFNGQIIDMRRLVATLQAYGFVVDEIVYDPSDSIYSMVSKNAPFILSLSISREQEYKAKNEQMINPTIEILKSMSKNAKKTNNNITSINQNQNNDQTNLYVIESTKCKGIKYWPSIKKLFKERPKLAIALCTLTAVTTVAAGGFIVKTAVDRIETQKYLDSKKQYEEQTTMPEYSLNSFIDETKQNFEKKELTESMNLEKQEMNETQLDQNYQRTR